MSSEGLSLRRRLAPKLRCVIAMLSLSLGSLVGGCIIPYNFRDIPAETNKAPAIQEELTIPKFGPLDGNALLQFEVVVDDPNLEDELTAQIFEVKAGAAPDEFTGIADEQSDPDPDPETFPFRRHFILPSGGPVNFCNQLHAGVFAVVVTDRPLSVSVKDRLTDRGLWTVSCTN